MYIAWVGTDYHGLNLITTTDGQTFTGHYASVQQSSTTPAMCTNGTNLYFAWAGTDRQGLPQLQAVPPPRPVARLTRRTIVPASVPSRL